MIWKDVKGFEGVYQVSDSGLVRSLERYMPSTNQWGKYKRHCPQKILKNVLHKNGYYRVDLCRKLYSVHTLVAQAFCYKKEGATEVNHIDGNKLNNHYKNLEWCTHSENIIHADRMGLRDMSKLRGVPKASGIDHACSKIIIDFNTGIFYYSTKEASLYCGYNENILSKMLRGIIKNKTSLSYA